MGELRPSSLPYLIQCGGYQSTPGSGYPAERGTLMDAAFRKLLRGEPAPEKDSLTPLDCQSVKWAVEMARFCAGSSDILTKEEDCKVEIPGIPRGGTVDAIIPMKNINIDLKSGRRYDYEAQQAAYALGLMTQYFLGSWTSVVLYCDQQEIVYYHFDSQEQCSRIIEAAKENLSNGKREISEFCKWCKHFENCPKVEQAIDDALNINAINLHRLEREPKEVSLFLRQMSVAKEFESRVKANIKSTGRQVPGYFVASDATFETVNPPMLGKYAKEIGMDALLQLFDKANGKKVRALLKQKGIKLTKEEEEKLFQHSYQQGKLMPGTKRPAPAKKKATSNP